MGTGHTTNRRSRRLFWIVMMLAVVGTTTGIVALTEVIHTPSARKTEPLSAAYKLTDDQLAHELSDPDVMYWGTAMGAQRQMATCMQNAGFVFKAFVPLPPRSSDPAQPGYGLLVKDESYASNDPNPAIRDALGTDQQALYDSAFGTCAAGVGAAPYASLTKEYTATAAGAQRTDAESQALASANGIWQSCMASKGEQAASPAEARQSVQTDLDQAQAQVNATNQLPTVLADQMPQLADAATKASVALQQAEAAISPPDVAQTQKIVSDLAASASQASALAGSPTNGQGDTKSADAMAVAAATDQSVRDSHNVLGDGGDQSTTAVVQPEVATASAALSSLDSAGSDFRTDFKNVTDAGIAQTNAALAPVRDREQALATKDYICRASVRTQIGDPLHDSVARALTPFVRAHREEINALYP